MPRYGFNFLWMFIWRGGPPMPVSHYQASWWDGSKGLPEPVYPGTPYDGKKWDKHVLREHYRPWREVEAQGVQVHIGEFGCYNKTPNDIALCWFSDLFSLFKEFKWGYSLWDFVGPFGIVEHGRAGTKYENIQSYKVDRALLDLMLESRVSEKEEAK